jgi:mono/diheme cytochrome c family protein
VRLRLFAIPVVAVALTVSACGTQGIQVAQDDPTYAGAVTFAQRCSGCHTISAAGTQGSGNRAFRNQGPNLDQRKVSLDDALFAIRNGGFSGAIMPQNIVTGKDAQQVAAFVARWSGKNAKSPAQPGGG